MPAWWDSLDSVSTFSWWMRWLGIGFTVLAAFCGSLALMSIKREEVLKTKRDAIAKVEAAELAEVLRRRQEGRTFRLSEEMKAALRTAPAEINQILYPVGRGEAVQLAGDIWASMQSCGWTVVAQPRGVILEGGPHTGSDPLYKQHSLIKALMQGYTSLGTDVSVFSKDKTISPSLALLVKALESTRLKVGLEVDETLPPNTFFIVVIPMQ